MSAAAKMQAAPGLLEEAERSRAEARTRLALLYRALGWEGRPAPFRRSAAKRQVLWRCRSLSN